MKYYSILYPLAWLKLRQVVPNVEYVEQLETYYTILESIKWYNYLGKLFGNFLSC